MALNLVPVFCRGCGREIGFVYGPRGAMQTMYCTHLCAFLPDLGREQERDDIIEDLARAGWSQKKIHELFDITSQRINQIVATRLG